MLGFLLGLKLLPCIFSYIGTNNGSFPIEKNGKQVN